MEQSNMAKDGQIILERIPRYRPYCLNELSSALGTIIALAGEEITDEYPIIKEVYALDDPKMPEMPEEVKCRVIDAINHLQQAQAIIQPFYRWISGQYNLIHFIEEVDSDIQTLKHDPTTYESLKYTNGLID